MYWLFAMADPSGLSSVSWWKEGRTREWQRMRGRLPGWADANFVDSSSV